MKTQKKIFLFWAKQLLITMFLGGLLSLAIFMTTENLATSLFIGFAIAYSRFASKILLHSTGKKTAKFLINNIYFSLLIFFGALALTLTTLSIKSIAIAMLLYSIISLALIFMIGTNPDHLNEAPEPI